MDGGSLELNLVFLEVQEEDLRVELACASQNVLGNQKVFVQIKLEGECSCYLFATNLEFDPCLKSQMHVSVAEQTDVGKLLLK